jgi:hypothetical protein
MKEKAAHLIIVLASSQGKLRCFFKADPPERGKDGYFFARSLPGIRSLTRRSRLTRAQFTWPDHCSFGSPKACGCPSKKGRGPVVKIRPGLTRWPVTIKTKSLRKSLVQGRKELLTCLIHDYWRRVQTTLSTVFIASRGSDTVCPLSSDGWGMKACNRERPKWLKAQWALIGP